jgi:hypothetical protein
MALALAMSRKPLSGSAKTWHASGFLGPYMCRRGPLVLIVALATLTMYPSTAQEGVPEAQVRLPVAAHRSTPQPSVTIQHQLIQIEPAPRPRPVPKVRRALPSTRLAYGPLVRRDNLAVRARRVVTGDGRFRPEPFPRLDR